MEWSTERPVLQMFGSLSGVVKLWPLTVVCLRNPVPPSRLKAVVYIYGYIHGYTISPPGEKSLKRISADEALSSTGMLVALTFFVSSISKGCATFSSGPDGSVSNKSSEVAELRSNVIDPAVISQDDRLLTENLTFGADSSNEIIISAEAEWTKRKKAATEPKRYLSWYKLSLMNRGHVFFTQTFRHWTDVGK